MANEICSKCIFNGACKFEDNPATACASPPFTFCAYCEHCEKHIEEITEQEYYFCRLNDNRPTGKMDFCSRGIAKEQGSAQPAPAQVSNPAPENRKSVHIYTDGACKGNPGPGGWGAIVVFGKKEKSLGGGEASTTNNRMELTAVIEALRALKETCDVTITTDSKYVVDAITKRWVKNWQANDWKKTDGKPALNIDLWEHLLDLLEKHTVSFEWIKGHAGHPYNQRCDKIACEYAEKNKI